VEWGAGHYEVIADEVLPAAEVVVETAAITTGERVVDVGCGTGNAALLAAEHGAKVTGVDPAKRLLEVAAAEASRRGLDVRFEVGEAASMPLPDEAADVELSVFGAIFAPDPEAAAQEMARVLSPAGRIVLSAWIPEGAISQGARLIRQTMSEILDQDPPSPPFPWHQRDTLEELFGPYGLDVRLKEHEISFVTPSAEAFVARQEENHPIAVSVRPALEESGRAEELHQGLLRIYRDANEDPDGFRVTSRYVVAALTRPA
jgi:SAM-dependent methyltransferase